VTNAISTSEEVPPSFRDATNVAPMQSSLLLSLPFVRHGVTRRVRGMGLADGNVGYGAPRNQADAWEMRKLWSRSIEFDAGRIVGLRQVHGADVREVGAADAGSGSTPGSEPVARADALITRDKGVTLMTLHADCLPILLVDPETPAVAAVHAGWRGTVEDVSGATVRAMQNAFGSKSSALLTYFGPSIGPCCYDVGGEVVDLWRSQAGSTAGEALSFEDGSTTLNLRQANQMLLKRAGVELTKIEISEVCTKCNGENWFSHRGQGAETGRFAAFIALIGSNE
jgi:purine-nucleoside/S-methyl-5'-thioadenosine phosphorylase / adenosine deaminase